MKVLTPYLLVCTVLLLVSCHKKNDNPSPYDRMAGNHSWSGTVFYYETAGSASHGHNSWTDSTSLTSYVSISADHSTAVFLGDTLPFQCESTVFIVYGDTASAHYLKYFKSSGSMSYRNLDQSNASLITDMNLTAVK